MNEETFYKIKLDLVHNTINNFVHVMQYDDGVAYIRAEIYKDWQHVYPSEEFDSAELRLKKHDGAWIKCNSVEPYIPVAKPPYAEAKEAGVYYYYSEGSYILVTSSMTEQAYNEIDPGLFYKNIGIIISLEHDYVKINVVSALTDIYGGCAAVIDLYSTDGHIQTAKFVLDVDRNPIQTGETIKNVPDDISIKLAELSGGLASAVKVTPQTLTDEEKAQARENINSTTPEYVDNKIEEVKNNPDVRDIVQTKQDLDNYDTSILGNNDIIRVLIDETRNNASTFYKYDKPNLTWNYIGQASDSYTKEQADSRFVAKISTTSSSRRLYTVAQNGGQELSYTFAQNGTTEPEEYLSQSYIAGYSSGCLTTRTPKNEYHCANKKYVDENGGPELEYWE